MVLVAESQHGQAFPVPCGEMRRAYIYCHHAVRPIPTLDLGPLTPAMERTLRDYALSLKQPWAALLAHGRKTIEVRRWPTARRGRILIHAARVPDERPEAWAHVPPEWLETAQLLGGIIGAGEITD